MDGGGGELMHLVNLARERMVEGNPFDVWQVLSLVDRVCSKTSLESSRKRRGLSFEPLPRGFY